MKLTFAQMLFTLFAAVTAPAMAHSGHAAHGHGSHGAEAHQSVAHGHAVHAAPGHMVRRSFPDPATAARPDGVVVEGCWIRALPNRLPAAGYFVVRNSSQQPAVLIGAQADGFGRVMLHTHQTVNGMSAMVHVDRVDVPAGGRFEFAPGGYHLMLEKPESDLQGGSRLPVTLWFEGDRALTFDCDVRGPAAQK